MLNLDEMIAGYIACGLWAETDNSDEPFDSNYGPEDIAPSSLASMRRTCESFAAENAADLDLYLANVDAREGSPSSYAGHDLWLSANGHGCGFWDRDGVGSCRVSPRPGEAPDLGMRLTCAAKKFASDLYLGDDGAVYVSPELTD